jgi:chromosome segregation ATPase
MSRTDNLSYQSLSTACHELLASGEKPSVRKIRERIGGSFSTISVLLQQWQEEQSFVNKIDLDLSDPFRQAVLAEFGRVTTTLRQRFLEQLNTEKSQLKEIQSLLAECEAKNEQITEDFTLHQKTTAQNLLALEKELASAKALVNEKDKRETSLQASLDAMRDKVHAAELKVAISETRCQEIEKQSQRLEKENKELKNPTKT